MTNIETVEVSTGDDPTGSVIWLHGLGADGNDFEPIVPQLGVTTPLRFVFPHAPVRPVTVNGGIPMRAWYDIRSLDSNGRADEDGVRDSGTILEALVEREIERDIPAKRIVIAGFSQGGAVVLRTLLTTKHDLAGAMALSTYLALPQDIDTARSRKDLPIFMAHGTFDPVLQHAWGRASADKLIEAGYSPDWHEYPMAHAVCPQEVADIGAWLRKIFG